VGNARNYWPILGNLAILANTKYWPIILTVGLFKSPLPLAPIRKKKRGEKGIEEGVFIDRRRPASIGD